MCDGRRRAIGALAGMAVIVVGVATLAAGARGDLSPIRDALAADAQAPGQEPGAGEVRGSADKPPADTTVTVLDPQEVQSILGRQVLSSAGEDMGRVVDVVVDGSGQVRAAIIDFGGFLGVGNRKVAVAWNALRFAPTGSKSARITLELTRDQIRGAPEYKDDRPLVVFGTADGTPPN
jgi:hypothetical protein